MRTLLTLTLFSTMLCAQAFGQWTATNLSEGKTSMGSVAYGSKIYFGGGGGLTEDTKKVEIYDVITGEWASEQFSIPREFSAAGAAGGKVLFAGGINFYTLDHYSRVDIFDTLTHTWTTAELPEQKFDVAAISYGDRIFVAGGLNIITGLNSSAVNIYNAETGEWTAASLSEGGAVRAVAVGSKLYFVGAGVMDIYDTAADSWTTLGLPDIRPFAGVAAVGNKIIVAGGMNLDNTPSSQVDIYDLSTGTWAMASLSLPRAFLNNAASMCGKAFFAGGGNFNLNAGAWTTATNQVDIYDSATGEWTTDYLIHPVVNHSVIASGGHLLVAGGIDPADLTVVFSDVDIYACGGVNALSGQEPSAFEISTYPNPTNGLMIASIKGEPAGNYLLTVSDLHGRVLQSQKLENPVAPEQHLDLSSLPTGVYLIGLSSEAGSFSEKLVKQ